MCNGKVTQNIVKQSVKLSYGEKVTDAYLLRLSGSKHHRHWKLQNALVVHPAFKTEPNAIKLANRKLDSIDADLQA